MGFLERFCLIYPFIVLFVMVPFVVLCYYIFILNLFILWVLGGYFLFFTLS
jgi:hypothetical protein